MTISRFQYEIIAVLLIKLALIMAIKMIWFSNPAEVNDQAVAAKLLVPAETPAFAIKHLTTRSTKEHP